MNKTFSLFRQNVQPLSDDIMQLVSENPNIINSKSNIVIDIVILSSTRQESKLIKHGTSLSNKILSYTKSQKQNKEKSIK